MIAIPNTEMPKSCYNHCNFIAMKEIGCPLKEYEESHNYKDKIHPQCPLLEMDEEAFRHLKALYKKLKEKYKCVEEDEEGVEEDFDPYQGDRDRDTFGEIY